MNLETRLLTLGLSDKEVAVYMAMLFMGASTAQDISIRAKINRATTYVMINTLIDRGLASQIAKDKKTYFQAEDPIQILKVLEKKKEEIDEKMGQARLIIPELQGLFNLNRTKINVRLIEGREAFKIIQNDIARSKGKSFDNITNISLTTEKAPINEDDHRRIYYKEKFKIRSIFTYDPKKPIPQLNFMSTEDRRMISQEKFPVFGEIVFYDNKIAMVHSLDKPFAVVIEDENLAKTFKTIFELAWAGAEKYQFNSATE